jgi:exopolyphosphatase/pppGpp-phosphohydrolase
MKNLSIEYAYDEKADAYIILQSDIIGINLWDRDLTSLINRVARSAFTYISLNHPELLNLSKITLSFKESNGKSQPIIRKIPLRPQIGDLH